MLRNRGTCGKLKGIHGLLYHSCFLGLCYGRGGLMRCDVSHSHLTVPECFADRRGGERCSRGDRAMEGDAGMSLLYA